MLGRARWGHDRARIRRSVACYLALGKVRRSLSTRVYSRPCGQSGDRRGEMGDFLQIVSGLADRMVGKGSASGPRLKQGPLLSRRNSPSLTKASTKFTFLELCQVLGHSQLLASPPGHTCIAFLGLVLTVNGIGEYLVGGAGRYPVPPTGRAGGLGQLVRALMKTVSNINRAVVIKARENQATPLSNLATLSTQSHLLS